MSNKYDCDCNDDHRLYHVIGEDCPCEEHCHECGNVVSDCECCPDCGDFYCQCCFVCGGNKNYCDCCESCCELEDDCECCKNCHEMWHNCSCGDKYCPRGCLAQKAWEKQHGSKKRRKDV